MRLFSKASALLGVSNQLISNGLLDVSQSAEGYMGKPANNREELRSVFDDIVLEMWYSVTEGI
jgi:hypothetical protein